jgi:hypothetical protein
MLQLVPAVAVATRGVAARAAGGVCRRSDGLLRLVQRGAGLEPDWQLQRGSSE